MSKRIYRPDVGDYMSDRAYRLYKDVEFKASHTGTDRNEAERCKNQLKTILQRDRIPIEEKVYRRKDESDWDFQKKVNEEKKRQANSSPKSTTHRAFTSTQYSNAQYHANFDTRDQQTQRERERLNRERQFNEREQQIIREEQERIWADLKARNQQVKSQWQRQSDKLHDSFNRRPNYSGPRQRTNTHTASSQQAPEINPFFLFIILVILYFIFK